MARARRSAWLRSRRDDAFHGVPALVLGSWLALESGRDERGLDCSRLGKLPCSGSVAPTPPLSIAAAACGHAGRGPLRTARVKASRQTRSESAAADPALRKRRQRRSEYCWFFPIIGTNRSLPSSPLEANAEERNGRWRSGRMHVGGGVVLDRADRHIQPVRRVPGGKEPCNAGRAAGQGSALARGQVLTLCQSLWSLKRLRQSRQLRYHPARRDRRA